MLRPHGRSIATMLSFCFAGMLLGCRSGETDPPPKHKHHIRCVWHIYNEYMEKKRSRAGAENLDELKAWVKANVTPERLKLMAVYDVDDACVSPRDNLPYVVRPMNPALANGGIVIYEAKGEGGERWVAYGTDARVVELSESEFQAAIR